MLQVTAIATMLYAMAEGPALAQLEKVLKFSNLFEGQGDEKAILLAFRETYRYLTGKKSRTEEMEEDSSAAREFQLKVINRVLVQKGADLNPEFLERLAKNLKVEIEEVDFTNIEGQSDLESFLKEKIQGRFDLTVPEELIDLKYNG